MSDLRHDALIEKMEMLEVEVETYRKLGIQINQQLNSAIEVIKFYDSDETWECPFPESDFVTIIEEDHFIDRIGDTNIVSGGKKARQWLKENNE